VSDHAGLFSDNDPIGPGLAISLAPLFSKLMAAESLAMLDLARGRQLEPFLNSLVRLLLRHGESSAPTWKAKDYSNQPSWLTTVPARKRLPVVGQAVPADYLVGGESAGRQAEPALLLAAAGARPTLA
jgi:hypothetical protein